MVRGHAFAACLFALVAALSAPPSADAAPPRAVTKAKRTPVKKNTAKPHVSKPASGSRRSATSPGHSSAQLSSPSAAAGAAVVVPRVEASSGLESSPAPARAAPAPGQAAGAAEAPSTPAIEPAAPSTENAAAAPEASSSASSSVGVTAPLIALGSPRDRAESTPTPAPRRWLTVGVNPLPVIAGRYGLNVELVPLQHHAIVASAWVQTFTPAMLRVVMPKEIDVSRGADTRFGGELGYRFYSGTEGAHGLFVGMSGVAMPIAYPRATPDFRTEVVSFHAYGGAIDVGAQAITSSGFTIGGGLGVMYLAYTPPALVRGLPSGLPRPELPEPHVLPRLLLAAGWSF